MLRRALDPDPAQRFVDAPQMLTEVKRLARLCEATLDEGCPEPRAYLGALMNRFFRTRVDYARAALRRTGEHEALAGAGEETRARAWAVEATVQVPRMPTGSNPTLTDASLEPVRASPLNSLNSLVEGRPPTASRPHVRVTETPAPAPDHAQPRAANPLSQWVMWLLLPMLGAGIAVVVMLSLDLSSPQAVPPPVQRPQPRATSATQFQPTPRSMKDDDQVRWYFTTDPAGATVLIDGEPWPEVTPTRVQLPYGEDTVEITLALDGYQRKLLPLVPLNDQNFNEALEAKPEPEPEPAVKPRVRTQAKARSKSEKPTAEPTPEKKFLPAPDSLKH
jgi:serine/threonine-protein kinase